MELENCDLGIHTLRKQLDNCRDLCASLAKEFEVAETSAQRTRLADTWDTAMKQYHATQLLLELLEKQEKQGFAQADLGAELQA